MTTKYEPQRELFGRDLADRYWDEEYNWRDVLNIDCDGLVLDSPRELDRVSQRLLGGTISMFLQDARKDLPTFKSVNDELDDLIGHLESARKLGNRHDHLGSYLPGQHLLQLVNMKRRVQEKLEGLHRHKVKTDKSDAQRYPGMHRFILRLAEIYRDENHAPDWSYDPDKSETRVMAEVSPFTSFVEHVYYRLRPDYYQPKKDAECEPDGEVHPLIAYHRGRSAREAKARSMLGYSFLPLMDQYDIALAVRRAITNPNKLGDDPAIDFIRKARVHGF